VDNNYLDLGMSKSGFIHTLLSGRLTSDPPLAIFRELPPLAILVPLLVLRVPSSVGLSA
jgi:hypothetical protein